MRKVLFASLSVLILAVASAGCSSSGADQHSMSGSTTSTRESNRTFNAADVRFAQGMIPHHAQAIDMAQLAAARASSAAVTELASRIRQAQQPEIDQMTAWLRAWKKAVPSTSGTDMGSHSRMGMMTPAEMSGLTAASGAAFDTMFLKMMIEHHSGAVDMAKTELQKGKYPPAKTLADSIVASQEEQITGMQQLLGAS